MQLVERMRNEAGQARRQQTVATQAKRSASSSKTPLIVLTEPNGATSSIAPSPPRNKQVSLHNTLGRTRHAACMQIVTLMSCDSSITGSVFRQPETDATASPTTAHAPAVSSFEQRIANR